MTGDQRKTYWEKVDAFVLKHLKAAAPGSDLQRYYFNSFAHIAVLPESVAYGRDLLEGKARISGLPINQDERWQLIKLLAANAAPDAQALIDAEIKKDSTDMGQHAAAGAGATIANPASKAQWLDSISAPALNPSHATLPMSQLRDATQAYQSLRDEDAVRASIETYFSIIPKLSEFSDSPYASFFSSWMYPGLCDPVIIERTRATIAAHPELPADVLKALRIAKQAEERCIRARTKAVSP
jgi:aminopeptidase N